MTGNYDILYYIHGNFKTKTSESFRMREVETIWILRLNYFQTVRFMKMMIVYIYV